MSYTKTNWQTGDTITAEKLNHAEQGIYDNSNNSILVVNAEINEQSGLAILDKTWQEINDSITAIILFRGINESQRQIVINTYIDDGNVYTVDSIYDGINIFSFITDNSTGYPHSTSNE